MGISVGVFTNLHYVALRPQERPQGSGRRWMHPDDRPNRRLEREPAASKGAIAVSPNGCIPDLKAAHEQRETRRTLEVDEDRPRPVLLDGYPRSISLLPPERQVLEPRHQNPRTRR